MNILGSFSQYDRIILTLSPIRFFNNEERSVDCKMLSRIPFLVWLRVSISMPKMKL